MYIQCWIIQIRGMKSFCILQFFCDTVILFITLDELNLSDSDSIDIEKINHKPNQNHEYKSTSVAPGVLFDLNVHGIVMLLLSLGGWAEWQILKVYF